MNKQNLMKWAKRGAAMAIWALPVIVLAQTSGDPYGQDILEPILSDTLGRRDPRETVAAIINIALSLLGILAVAIIIIGGFTWMTAGGNEENVDKAKKWIFAGIIGLAIILSAYAIATWVINNLVAVTTGS